MWELTLGWFTSQNSTLNSPFRNFWNNMTPEDVLSCQQQTCKESLNREIYHMLY